MCIIISPSVWGRVLVLWNPRLICIFRALETSAHLLLTCLVCVNRCHLVPCLVFSSWEVFFLFHKIFPLSLCHLNLIGLTIILGLTLGQYSLRFPELLSIPEPSQLLWLPVKSLCPSILSLCGRCTICGCPAALGYPAVLFAPFHPCTLVSLPCVHLLANLSEAFVSYLVFGCSVLFDSLWGY